MPDAKKPAKAPPPAPLPDGTPYCVACKSFHPAPTSKDHWQALKCFGPNPFPAPKMSKPAKTSAAGRDLAMQAGGRRLPDGATFHVEYDAVSQAWSGKLTIPGRDGAMGLEFRGKESAVFKLLSKLDDQYRKAASDAH